MADALPPDAKAQVEALKAFSQDVELAVRTRAKGGGAQPVTLEELQDWLGRALATNEDAPVFPLAGGPGEGTGYLTGKNRDAVLKELKKKIDTRVAELEKTPANATMDARAWLTATLVELAKNRVIVETKAGATRAASLDEVRQWLGAASPSTGRPPAAAERKAAKY